MKDAFVDPAFIVAGTVIGTRAGSSFGRCTPHSSGSNLSGPQLRLWEPHEIVQGLNDDLFSCSHLRPKGSPCSTGSSIRTPGLHSPH